MASAGSLRGRGLQGGVPPAVGDFSNQDTSGGQILDDGPSDMPEDGPAGPEIGGGADTSIDDTPGSDGGDDPDSGATGPTGGNDDILPDNPYAGIDDPNDGVPSGTGLEQPGGTPPPNKPPGTPPPFNDGSDGSGGVPPDMEYPPADDEPNRADDDVEGPSGGANNTPPPDNGGINNTPPGVNGNGEPNDPFAPVEGGNATPPPPPQDDNGDHVYVTPPLENGGPLDGGDGSDPFDIEGPDVEEPPGPNDLPPDESEFYQPDVSGEGDLDSDGEGVDSGPGSFSPNDDRPDSSDPGPIGR